MAKPLNFNSLKKKYLTVTLPNDNRTVLMIGTPTKAILDEFLSLQDSIEDLSGNMQGETLDLFYDICSKIMSRNKAGIDISREFVSEIFDFEDVIVFIQAYTEFIQEISNAKNS